MFNGANVSNSQSIVSEFFERNFPGGQSIVKSTSSSKFGNVANRTLTSQSIEATVSLNNLFRDPRFVLTQRNRIVQSSLNDVVTAGLETVYSSGNSITIVDPENTNGVRTLTGSAAANRILLDSVVTTNAGTDFITSDISYLGELARFSSLEAQGYNIVGPNGKNFQHGPENPISQNAGTVSSGGRLILTDSNFNEGEKEWYLERARQLNETGFFSSGGHLVNGFDFDLPDEARNLHTAGTYFPGLSDSATHYIPDSIASQGVVKAYIAPALIEMLLYMSSDEADITIKSFSGTSRGSNVEGQGANFTRLQSGNTVTAHAMGRAADISMVTNRDGTKGAGSDGDGTYSNDETADVYRVSLDIFLAELNILGAVRPDLLPDQIIVHDGLMTHYGIREGGFEGEDTAIKQMYPNLKYVDIAADDNHRNHIHITYSPERAGVYSGPGGSMNVISASTTEPSGGSSNMPVSIGDAIGTYNNPRFMSSYLSNPSNSLTPKEIAELLSNTWCSKEAACIFAAIAQRESSYHPTAINPDIGSGDYSIGLWQINLIAVWGKKQFHLFTDQENSVSSGLTQKGWQLGYRNWLEDEWTDQNYEQRFAGLGNSAVSGEMSDQELRVLSNPSIWVPMNQAYMLYTLCAHGNPPAPHVFSASDRLAVSPEEGYIFSPWGDYGSGEEDLLTGWIYGVKYKVAYDAYVQLGGVGSELTDWVISMFETDGAGSRSAPFAEQWVQGYMFTRKSTVGTITSDSQIS